MRRRAGHDASLRFPPGWRLGPTSHRSGQNRLGEARPNQRWLVFWLPIRPHDRQRRVKSRLIAGPPWCDAVRNRPAKDAPSYEVLPQRVPWRKSVGRPLVGARRHSDGTHSTGTASADNGCARTPGIATTRADSRTSRPRRPSRTTSTPMVLVPGCAQTRATFRDAPQPGPSTRQGRPPRYRTHLEDIAGFR